MQKNILEKYKDKVKFSEEKPPVYDQCVELFGISWNNTVFAYGDTIHCKSIDKLTDHLIEHEMVHLKQQGGNPQVWWERYFVEGNFRLEQEIQAYQREYRYLRGKSFNKEELHKLVRMWAINLSGGFYGDLTTYKEAYNLITK